MAIKPLDAGDVKFLAVHCSATPPNRNIGAAEIDRWHRDRGWLKIGYHFVVRRDGTVEGGRPLTQRGAHVEDFNHCSIGICLVGGVDKLLQPQDNFTPKQLTALHLLLDSLLLQFPGAAVQGHRDFPGVKKACPSFDCRAWFNS